ncbi:MAG: hypothetical protein IT459_07990 [Planctomycetes bacterium]|nr:hypothetical protein [Planctomycetota bacterium]
MIRLHRLGTGARALSRALKMGRDTVRHYVTALRDAALLDGDASDLPELEVLRSALAAQLTPTLPRQQTSSIEDWRPQITDLRKLGAGPQAIFDRLRLEHDDFPGSLSAVKRLCLRIDAARGVRAEDVALRVETSPGEVAQVDFGFAGVLFDPERGVKRRAWVFVLVLGHSRHMFAEIVFDQRVAAATGRAVADRLLSVSSNSSLRRSRRRPDHRRACRFIVTVRTWAPSRSPPRSRRSAHPGGARDVERSRPSASFH